MRVMSVYINICGPCFWGDDVLAINVDKSYRERSTWDERGSSSAFFLSCHDMARRCLFSLLSFIIYLFTITPEDTRTDLFIS